MDDITVIGIVLDKVMSITATGAATVCLASLASWAQGRSEYNVAMSNSGCCTKATLRLVQFEIRRILKTPR